MRKLFLLLSIAVLSTACAANKKKQDTAGLEKYPQCYHDNVKLSNACIQKNKAGENVTALQLENAAYPGQYK